MIDIYQSDFRTKYVNIGLEGYNLNVLICLLSDLQSSDENRPKER